MIKGGEIIETGSHSELLSKPAGEFARLVNMYQAVSKVRAVER